MATRLPDGSIQMSDGRILYANSVILAQDLLEILPLLTPPPAWPFVSGGGGGGPGPQGPAGPAGSGGGGGAGTQGQQGFQGTNPGVQGPQGDLGAQGNQGLTGAGIQGPQGNQGNLGAQGNQGIAGAGVQGPQGNSGVDGAAGAQGPQGNAGADGTQGFQGFQGNEGTGVQGPQGFQGNVGLQGAQGALNPDIFVATRVVSAAGDGTDTTIAAALAALPAGGGSVYIKQGTYALGATLTLPTARPVTIVGSGKATIIDLGANAIAAFTVPAGYTTNTPILIKSLSVIGTEVANQTFLEYADSNSLAEVSMEDIQTTGVEKTINVTSSASASSTPGQDDARFHMLRCRIRPNATNNSVILSNPSVGYPRCWMTEVEFIGDSLFAIPGGRTAPLFGRLASDDWFGDCYLDGCEMSIGTGESDFAAFESVNSIFWNNDNVNTIIDWFIFGSFTGFNNGSIMGSTFRRIHIEAEEAGINFISNWFENCPLELYGQGIVIGDNQITQSGTWPVAFPYVIQVNNENMVIRHNVFEIGSPPTFVVDLEAPCTITGNDFSDVNNGTNGSIYLNSGDAIVHGNRFEFAPTGGPPLREINGPTWYSDNVDLWWEQLGAIQAPVVPRGNRDTIQGMNDWNGTGAVGGIATNTIVVNYRNIFGLAQTIGYIQNTGANNITVREQYFTQNLGTFTRSTVIGAGVKRTLNPFDFAGLAPAGIDNQVIKYTADVSGTNIAWQVYFGAPNGMDR